MTGGAARQWRMTAVLLTAGWLAAGEARADVSVVTSIKPVHSLVASIMDGTGEPFLVVEGSASPHTYSMRPSEARALEQADVVFWVGKEMEAFLAKPLEALGGDARVVSLAAADGVTLRPTRQGGSWEGHGEHAHDGGHGHDDDDEHAHQHDHENDEGHGTGEGGEHDGPARHGAHDMHIWLDPTNAKGMAQAIAAALAEADPANADRYRANAATLTSRIDGLDTEIAESLAPVREVPYVVFHDAYQYFERRYGLNAIGSITVAPGRNPGAKRLYEIRDKIATLGAACVFAEPQFEPALVATVAEGTGARHGILDPLGSDIPAGPEAYFTLIGNLAQSLERCLAASG